MSEAVTFRNYTFEVRRALGGGFWEAFTDVEYTNIRAGYNKGATVKEVADAILAHRAHGTKPVPKFAGPVPITGAIFSPSEAHKARLDEQGPHTKVMVTFPILEAKAEIVVGLRDNGSAWVSTDGWDPTRPGWDAALNGMQTLLVYLVGEVGAPTVKEKAAVTAAAAELYEHDYPGPEKAAGLYADLRTPDNNLVAELLLRDIFLGSAPRVIQFKDRLFVQIEQDGGTGTEDYPLTYIETALMVARPEDDTNR
jgi:hypothetical protein